jgi:hypothetical protein
LAGGDDRFRATMTGEGFFTGDLKPFIISMAATMVGEGTLSGDLLTLILLVALMQGEGFLTGDLKVARFMGRLTTCGDPLTTFRQDWIPGNEALPE